MKPKIGIVCGITESEYRYDLSQCNVNAISEAGGIPILIPYDMKSIDDYLSMVDGIYLTGGGDISPLYANQEPNKNIGFFYPDRDTFEIEICKKALTMKIPVLGICRGCQVINVVSGGSLYQDLNTEIENHICHKNPGNTPFSAYVHSVKINENTILYDIYKEKKIYTNSCHHQSIKEVAPNFIISAIADDGIIEAIENTGDNFALGIQWHPEAMFVLHKEALLIYKRFIKECRLQNSEF